MSHPNAASENAPSPRHGLAIASMVLGITAFFPGCCLAIYFVPFVLSVLAIVFGALSLKRSKSGMAITGLVLGIVCISLYLALLIAGISASQFSDPSKWDFDKGEQKTTITNDIEGDDDTIITRNGKGNGTGDGIGDGIGDLDDGKNDGNNGKDDGNNNTGTNNGT